MKFSIASRTRSIGLSAAPVVIETTALAERILRARGASAQAAHSVIKGLAAQARQATGNRPHGHSQITMLLPIETPAGRETIAISLV